MDESPPQAVPPGMTGLITPLLGCPFALGGRDPAHGGLDCLGLILFLLREGLDIRLKERDGDVIEDENLLCLWRNPTPVTSPSRVEETAWRALVQPWDVIVWYDAAVQAMMQAHSAEAGLSWLHVGLAINQVGIVSSSIRDGVGFDFVDQITPALGRHALALYRPAGISAWQPVLAPRSAPHRGGMNG